MCEDEIRKSAYLLWETAGKPDGRSEEFWFQAMRNSQKKQRASSRKKSK